MSALLFLLASCAEFLLHGECSHSAALLPQVSDWLNYFLSRFK